jgi:hypothetical protein
MNFKGSARRRTADGIARAAGVIGCTENHLLAVMDVEAPRGPFDAQGRPNILFEPHVFYRNLTGAKRNSAVAQKLAHKSWGSIPYGSYASQYGKLARAMKIDATAALKACSWGSPQILGENHAVAGYPSAAKMVEAFAESEDEQLMAMARFIVSKKLGPALKRGDWAAFAKGYNGSGYKKNKYDTKLAAAFTKHNGGYRMGLGIMSADLAAEGAQDVAAPIDIMPTIVLQAGQTRLRELGYFTAGRPNGVHGTMSIGAVSSFQSDRGIAITGQFDEATMAELDKAVAEGWARPLSMERTEASAQEIKAQVPEAQAAWKAKLGAYWTAALGGVGFVGSSITSFAGDAWESTREVREFFGDIPTPVWFGVVGGLALFMAYQSRKAQKGTNDAFRSGERV